MKSLGKSKPYLITAVVVVVTIYVLRMVKTSLPTFLQSFVP